MMAEDLRRWVMCGAVIVFAHGAIAAGMVTWREAIEPAEPAAAIVIEFAPVPVAPAAPETEIPPGLEQVMSDASPNKPVESLEEEQKGEEKVASKAAEDPPPEIKPAQSSQGYFGAAGCLRDNRMNPMSTFVHQIA